jgi:hypothetical protein
VRIQNQTGPNPTKWDKTGLVVEVRQFDQYVVRVDGSGRVTLRNRKFLRKYIPVIPRAPLLMAPGPTTPPAVPRPATQYPKHTPPAQARKQIHVPPDTSATPPTMPPAVNHPTNTRHPPSQDDVEPTITPPNSPAASPVATLRPAGSPARQGPIPRLLRDLQPHNAPGLKERMAPAVAPPLNPSATAPRRSTRQPRRPDEL